MTISLSGKLHSLPYATHFTERKCTDLNSLFHSAVNTYKKNGKKNVMDPTVGTPDMSDKGISEEYEGSRLDIRRGGLVRIPVCSAEEATANLNKGRKYYGDSPNYPCNP